MQTWISRVAPEFVQVAVREASAQDALEIFRRASASGWGGVDLVTQDLSREPCVVHFSREALSSVDAAFALDLPSPIRAKDENGEDFTMAALMAGRGKLLVFYDRDGIVYRNKVHERSFRLASRIEFDTPTAGVLDNIHGICAEALLFGCLRIRSIVKDGEKVTVRAGPFTLDSPVTVIEARTGGAPAVRSTEEPAPTIHTR